MSAMPSTEAVERLIGDFDHHSSAFADNRLDFYARLHRGCPVLRSQAHAGFWYFGAFDDALAIQRAPTLFSNAQPTIPDAAFPAIIPAKRDPPEHGDYKRLLAPHFAPQAIDACAELIDNLTNRILGDALDCEEFDIVSDVMQPLVAELTGAILGIAPEKARAYARPLHNASLPDYPRAEAEREIHTLLEDIARDVAGLRAAPAGLLGELMSADFQGRTLTDEELQLIAVNLLIGGLGTTPIFVGSVTHYLAAHPEQRKALVDDPALLSGAIDEMLRAFSPVQTFARLVTTDTHMAGVSLCPGDRVLIGYGAANHDPKHFADPYTIDFARYPNRHMSFGSGPHRCLGSHLAKAVVSSVIGLLLRHSPDYEVVEDRVGRYRDVATKLGFFSVPVRPGSKV